MKFNHSMVRVRDLLPWRPSRWSERVGGQDGDAAWMRVSAIKSAWEAPWFDVVRQGRAQPIWKGRPLHYAECGRVYRPGGSVEAFENIT